MTSPPPAIPGLELGDPLGSGRHGTVWRATRTADGAALAVKTVPADRVSDRSRFAREARTLQAIAHPHIVRCLDAGEAESTLWLAMELAAGGDVAALVRRAGRPTEQTILEIARDAAAGLAELHRRGLVHRDLSPANLLLMSDGRCVLGDFGLVSGDGERLTRTGDVLGTPAYLSPEQAAGGTADARSDLYSLGAILYALATGRPPFTGETAWSVLTQVAAGPCPDPRTVVATISPQLRTIIRAATAHDPDLRYADAEALHADCIAVLAGGGPTHAGAVRQRARRVEPPPPGPPQPVRPPLAWIGAALAAGLALGLGLGWLGTRPDASERAAYAAARDAGTLAAWQDYLKRHPAGAGSGTARTAVRILAAPLPSPDTSARDALAAEVRP